MIAAYAPCSLSAAAACFAREVVIVAAPAGEQRCKALLFAAGRLACFAESVGLELDERLLCEPVIERFVLAGCEGMAPASVRTLRTNLRALARVWGRYPPPAPIPLSRERAKAPYSPVEVDGYLALADAQSTAARRLRASALICLGAGAGVIAGELRQVRGIDVVERSGGVLVVLGGSRARCVPVLCRYHSRLLEAASFAGEGLIIGGRDPQRRNVTDRLAALLCTDSSLPALQAGRLRSTWLTECAKRIGLQAFLQAAGIHCSQRLGDLAARLPEATEAELLALLGGSQQ